MLSFKTLGGGFEVRQLSRSRAFPWNRTGDVAKYGANVLATALLLGPDTYPGCLDKGGQLHNLAELLVGQESQEHERQEYRS